MSKLPPDHPPVRQVTMDGHRSGWLDVARWTGAGAIVLLAHAAGAYAIHTMQTPDQPDGAPPAAIMIELAPEPVAPDAEEAAIAPQVETAELTEEVAEADVPDTVDPVEPVEPVEQVQPDTPPEPVEEIVEEEEPVPDVVEAETPEVVVPKPVEKPKIVEKPKVEKPKVAEKPREKPKPKKAEKVEKADETRKAASPEINADSGPKIAANRNGESSGSPGVSSAKWSAKVQAHMERQRRFLQRKMGPRAKGLVQLSFTIDPAGNVLSVRIVSSSGNPELDQLMVETARRASPVPAPPPAIAKPRMTIISPFKFI